jgi:hypothetical protein
VNRLRGRSVLEVMVLTFVATVAFMLVAMGTAITVVKIRDPSADTDVITQSLISLVSAILGALLGLLAGKATVLDTRPDGTVSDLDAEPPHVPDTTEEP